MTDNPHEVYETPPWCVDRLLEAMGPLEGHWLDPCVGEGALPTAAGLPATWTCLDIRPTEFVIAHPNSALVADYTRLDLLQPLPRFDGCLMNPPFSHARVFAGMALSHCDRVIMLQRLSWMQSPVRAPFLRDNPFDLYVLPERPSFTNDGHTDAAGYGWYDFPSQGKGVQILASTPKEDRRDKRQMELPHTAMGPLGEASI